MIVKAPLAFAGQRIGLLGGSFDPPHPGHLHISRWALKAIGLDAVWWMVSPGNPLKEDGPADIDRRVSACRNLVDHPRIHVTDLERHLGSPYTANTLRYLGRRCPGVRFVWLMGADNLASFHRWEDWRWIVETHNVGILARPGEQVRAGLSLTSQLYARLRLDGSQARLLGHGDTARWALLNGPMSDHSSTRIRERGNWSV
ncbi:MAG: nicotinate-nucleotide adenylyltransferase [Pseudomonadota bacterium]